MPTNAVADARFQPAWSNAAHPDAEMARLHEEMLVTNEVRMNTAMRQHELAAASTWANARLQAEIKAHEETEDELRLAQAQLDERAVKLERVVAARTAELRATNQQLEAFVYSIAHDLRAP